MKFEDDNAYMVIIAFPHDNPAPGWKLQRGPDLSSERARQRIKDTYPMVKVLDVQPLVKNHKLHHRQFVERCKQLGYGDI